MAISSDAMYFCLFNSVLTLLVDSKKLVIWLLYSLIQLKDNADSLAFFPGRANSHHRLTIGLGQSETPLTDESQDER